MESNLAKALRASYDSEFEALIIEEHTFSDDFENKMSKLINRRKKPYYMMINTLGKRVACFVIAIFMAISVTALAFEDVREAIAGFFVSIFETHSTVDTVETGEAPETIEDIYRITYNLDGYSEDVWINRDTTYAVDYFKDHVCIGLHQYTRKDYKMNVNAEGAEIKEVKINGFTAMYFFDNHDYHHLFWDNGEYILYLTSNIDTIQFFKIAESIKK